MSYLNQLNNKVSSLSMYLNSVESDLRATEDKIKVYTLDLQDLVKSRDLISDSIDLLTKCLVEFENVTKHLSDFVTEGMNFLYPENYSINFYFSNNVAGATNGIWFSVEKDGILLEDPKDDLGDGEFSFIAMLLYLACFVKVTSPSNRVIMMDEPLPAVDEVAWQNFSEFLIQFCKTYNTQILTSTHVKVPFGKTFTIKDGEVVEVKEYDHSM